MNYYYTERLCFWINFVVNKIHNKINKNKFMEMLKDVVLIPEPPTCEANVLTTRLPYQSKFSVK